jgi:hypothetical protein
LIVVDPEEGASAMSTAAASRAGIQDDLVALSADFRDATALAPWLEHAPAGFAPKWHAPRVSNGCLVLQPVASAWFDDDQAGHLYKELSGDFVVTALIRVSGLFAELPQTEFSLAGLFARVPHAVSAASWRPRQENWLFFSIGTASPAGAPQYEVKSTTNSLSTLKVLKAQTGWAELRLARHGELFTLLDRPEGRPDWRVIDQMIRPDLPEMLAVGLAAGADYGSVAPTYPDFRAYNERGVGKGNADLIAEISWVRFRRPITPRFPIANLDAAATFGRDIIEARRWDLTSD